MSDRIAEFTMPRIRGRTGEIMECPEEPEIVGKWTWQIQIYTVDAKARPTVHRQLNGEQLVGNFVFDTQEQAKASLEVEVKKIATELQKAAGGDGKEGLFNLNTGEWVKNG